ncbi:MAG TPA: DNA repair protein RecO [Dehalococcoidales bacterium]
MPNPRTYQTEAIIIKKTKLGEADRVLTLYTTDWGKIQAVARGVRRPRSKLAGHLELLTHSLVSLARGRNLDTIIGSQTIDSFLPLKSDLKLTAYALYATELVNQFTADHMENRPLFHLFLETLQVLCQAANNDLRLRYYEMHLLNEVGYRPQLQQCVICHRALQTVINSFSAGTGGLLCPDCRFSEPFAYPLSVNAQKVLRLLQDGDWATVSRLKLTPELSFELESVMRHYLRYLLEREVKSVAWLDTLRKQIEPIAPTPEIA